MPGSLTKLCLHHMAQRKKEGFVPALLRLKKQGLYLDLFQCGEHAWYIQLCLHSPQLSLPSKGYHGKNNRAKLCCTSYFTSILHSFYYCSNHSLQRLYLHSSSKGFYWKTIWHYNAIENRN